MSDNASILHLATAHQQQFPNITATSNRDYSHHCSWVHATSRIPSLSYIHLLLRVPCGPPLSPSEEALSPSRAAASDRVVATNHHHVELALQHCPISQVHPWCSWLQLRWLRLPLSAQPSADARLQLMVKRRAVLTLLFGKICFPKIARKVPGEVGETV